MTNFACATHAGAFRFMGCLNGYDQTDGLPRVQGHFVSWGSRDWQDSGGQSPGWGLQAHQQHTCHAVCPQGGRLPWQVCWRGGADPQAAV